MFHHKSASFILSGLITIFLCLEMGASGEEGAAGKLGGAFSLIPPAITLRLKEQASSAQGLAIIKSVDTALAQTPKATPHIHVEGTLPHQGIRDESEAAKKDWLIMRNLAIAFRLTGDHRYLDAENRFLTAWLDVYQINLNPIDETDLDQIFIAYDLSFAELPAPTQAKMKAFLRNLATGYLPQIEQRLDKPKEHENWQSHRIKLAVLASFALQDEALIARAEKAFQNQVVGNIRDDGSVEDFYKRDALHYVTYDLMPLTTAALAAKQHGHDWFDGKPGEKSVSLALDWLTPFALGLKKHEEFVHSKIGFDAARDHAGVKGFSGQWDPSHSINLYLLASSLDPKYRAVASQVIQNTGTQPQEWLSLLVQAGL